MSQKRPAAGGESRKRDSFLSCALRRAPRGYERWIDDEIPKEQRKRGYERRIDDVIPMNAENAAEIFLWKTVRQGVDRPGKYPSSFSGALIWQVETNVNLKKAGIL